MDTNFSLVIILFISTLFHLGINIKTFLAFIPSLNPNSMKWENARNFNYQAIITKMIFSISFFIVPILLFKHSKATLYKNEPLYFIVLIILILATWFFIYFNKYKIWSPKHNFNTVINKLTNKNIDKIHNQLSNHSKKIFNIYELQLSQSKKTQQNTLNIVSLQKQQINISKGILNFSELHHTQAKKTEQNTLDIVSLQNKQTNHSKGILNISELQHSQARKTEQNTLNIVSFQKQQINISKEINVFTKKTKNTYEQLSIHDKEITSTNQLINDVNKTTNKLNHELEELKAHKSNTGNKIFDLDSFFKSKSQYDNFITLLVDNDFYIKKHKHTATYLCILTTKLIDLKVININQKKEHFCNAIANHFKIEPYNPSNFSTAFKNYNHKSFSIAHQDIFNSFNYLDDIIEP